MTPHHACHGSLSCKSASKFRERADNLAAIPCDALQHGMNLAGAATSALEVSATSVQESRDVTPLRKASSYLLEQTNPWGPSDRASDQGNKLKG